MSVNDLIIQTTLKGSEKLLEYAIQEAAAAILTG
jgi:hypothetical protein